VLRIGGREPWLLALEVTASIGYSRGMGMGSLAKYRKIFMIFGFSIFLLGAVGRWHRNRQMGAVEQKSHLVNTPSESWLSDCVSYACRVLPAHEPECQDICNQAVQRGTPRTQAERIAMACKKHCSAESTPTAACAAGCFVTESNRSADPG
jgi:hypothetical protein